MQNFFELFGLQPAFNLDLSALNQAYRTVQAQVHPDKFASASEAEKRLAMQRTVQANEALQTLKNPLKRAAYLCEQAGCKIEAENNTTMPAEFLMQQMEWREALDALRETHSVSNLAKAGHVGKNVLALEKLEAEVNAAWQNSLKKLQQQIDVEKNYQQAVQTVRGLMFVEKFKHDIATLDD